MSCTRGPSSRRRHTGRRCSASGCPCRSSHGGAGPGRSSSGTAIPPRSGSRSGCRHRHGKARSTQSRRWPRPGIGGRARRPVTGGEQPPVCAHELGGHIPGGAWAVTTGANIYPPIGRDGARGRRSAGSWHFPDASAFRTWACHGAGGCLADGGFDVFTGVRRVAGASLSTARAVRVKRCWKGMGRGAGMAGRAARSTTRRA